MSIPAYDDDTGQGVLDYDPGQTPWSSTDPDWRAASEFSHLALATIEGARGAASAMITALRQMGQPGEADARAEAFASADQDMREAAEAAVWDHRHLDQHAGEFFRAMHRAAALLEVEPDQDEDQEPEDEDDGPWHDRLAATVSALGIDLSSLDPAELVGALDDDLKGLLLSALGGGDTGNVELARQYPVNMQRIGVGGATVLRPDISRQGGDQAMSGWPRLPMPGPGGIFGYNSASAPTRQPRSRGVRRRRAQAEARARRRAAAAHRFYQARTR